MEWYHILLIVIIIFIFIILTSTVFKGWYGEYIFYLKIKRITKVDGKIIRNIIVPKKNDNSITSQIDTLIISRRGIFVVEVKNFSGKIYGNDKSKEWTQCFNYGKQKYKFYSPVKQNLTHLKRIKEHLNDELDLHSIVVFINSDISSVESNYTYDIKSFMDFYNNKKILYSNEQIEYIYNYFIGFKRNKIKTTRQHIENIKEKEKKINKNVCPYCDKELVIRTGKYGDFYACVNYPECKFTKSIK